jgi:hypothetical protein
MHSAKCSVPTVGGRKKKIAEVTVYSFTSVMKGAMDTIYEKIDSISTGKPFISPSPDGILYLREFFLHFSAFLKSKWNVEFMFIGDTNGYFKSDRVRGNNIDNSKTFQLRGYRRYTKLASDYLESVVLSLRRNEKTIIADTSFKFKELLNFQKRIHNKYPRKSDSVAVVDTFYEEIPMAFFDIHPPMDPRGLQFMIFPIQVTCLCMVHDTYASKLQEVMNDLTRIEQEFNHQSISYSKQLVLQHLTDKMWRASFIQDSQISGVLWDQDTGNACMYI